LSLKASTSAKNLPVGIAVKEQSMGQSTGVRVDVDSGGGNRGHPINHAAKTPLPRPAKGIPGQYNFLI